MLLLLEFIYLCMYTHIYVLNLLKFERHVFFIVVNYFRKSYGFNWIKVEFISGYL
jgi:hypothetical protein